MKSLFADSWFYIALLDESDEHHRRAAEFAARSTARLVTTRWVLLEVANALCATASRVEAATFLQRIENVRGVKVIGQSDSLYERGLDLYAKRPDKAWSLTDCISFVVMREENLREALTGDRHFAQAGFGSMFA